MEPSFATIRVVTTRLATAKTLTELGDPAVAGLADDWGARRAQFWFSDPGGSEEVIVSEAVAPGSSGSAPEEDLGKDSNPPDLAWLRSLLVGLRAGTARVLGGEDLVDFHARMRRHRSDDRVAALILVPVVVSGQMRGALVCWVPQVPSERWVEALLALADVVGVSAACLLAARDRASARADADERIERLNRRQDLVLTSAGEGICGLDRDGTIVFANPAAARFLGYDVADLNGRPLHELTHYSRLDGTPYPRSECPIYAALQDGAVDRVTGEVFWRRDGTSFPVDYVSTPMRDRGTITGAVVIFSDVTERRQAEAAQLRLLRKAEAAEERFRGFLEWAPDAIVVVSNSGRIVFVNHQTEVMFGCGRDDLLGQPLEILVPDRLREVHLQHRKGYQDAPRTRPMGFGLSLFARRRDGTEFPVEISLSPSETAGGSVVTSVIRDISDRVRLFEAERQARADVEQLASERVAILGKIADAVILADPAGNVTFVNDAGHHLLPSTNTVGDGNGVVDVEMALRDLRTAQGRALTRDEIPLVRAACGGETVIGSQLRIRRPNGKEFIVEASATPVLAENGTRLGAVMTIHDVTAQRDLERQKDEFLANVSHDLRTPLTAIKASIGVVIANEPVGTPEPLHRILVNIELAADRMATLVSDLLELTRLQAGRAPLHVLWCDMSEAARRAARAIEPLAQARGQRLQVDLPAKPCFTWADPDRLDRALLNLLDNAQKYGKAEGAIRLSLAVHANEVVFAVTDDGPGISPHDQQRIFDRFYRSEAEATQLNQGSGLGLPIARAMVELHGGRIWVESAPGRGTTFSIALPLVSRQPKLIQKDARS